MPGIEVVVRYLHHTTPADGFERPPEATKADVNRRTPTKESETPNCWSRDICTNTARLYWGSSLAKGIAVEASRLASLGANGSESLPRLSQRVARVAIYGWAG